MTDQVNEALRALAERAIPFLRDEAEKYEDDGSNEPLELAREIESILASSPSDESALPSASLAFDGGAEAAHPSRGETMNELFGDSEQLTHPSRGVVDDEMVERACVALQQHYFPGVKWPGEYDDAEADDLRDAMRAALQAAALPAVPARNLEQVRSEAFNLADTVIEWIESGNVQAARDAIRASLVALAAPPAVPEADPAQGWRVEFVCCDREDGHAMAATWAEADAIREAYTSGVGVNPHGYSYTHAHDSGHQRAAIVKRATPAHDQPEGSGND